MKAEDWLVDFAAELKEELTGSLSNHTAEQVAVKINRKNLTEKQKEFVFQYFHAWGYDRDTGLFMLAESDNAAFLNLVDYIWRLVK